MALHNPPFYRYSLFEEWDKIAFEQIRAIGASKLYPTLNGHTSSKNLFLKTLIRSQKSLNDWRDLPKDVMRQVADNNSIDPETILAKYPPQSIGKGDVAWATYPEDKIVSDFMDELETREVDFRGTTEETGEFIIRFVLGQLGHDWEQTILLIWEMLGEDSSISLNSLNDEFRKFDYLSLLP